MDCYLQNGVQKCMYSESSGSDSSGSSTPLEASTGSSAKETSEKGEKSAAVGRDVGVALLGAMLSLLFAGTAGFR